VSELDDACCCCCCSVEGSKFSFICSMFRWASGFEVFICELLLSRESYVLEVGSGREAEEVLLVVVPFSKELSVGLPVEVALPLVELLRNGAQTSQSLF